MNDQKNKIDELGEKNISSENDLKDATPEGIKLLSKEDIFNSTSKISEKVLNKEEFEKIHHTFSLEDNELASEFKFYLKDTF